MKQVQSKTTKERILHIAIDLFAQRGFRDISVREIAGTVGVKASSLYKHFASKEDILESIFALFRAKIGQSSFSKEELDQQLRTLTPEQYMNDAFQLFKRVMWAPEMIKISKIITIEQHRNSTVRQFFVEEIIEKPNHLMRYVFEQMMQIGTIRPCDAGVLADEYNSYILSLYFEQNYLQESPNLDEIEDRMKRHNRFFAEYVLNGKEGERP